MAPAPTRWRDGVVSPDASAPQKTNAVNPQLPIDPEEGGPPPTRPVNGRAVSIAAFLALLALALFTYYVVPLFVTPYYVAKPGQTRELFNTLEAALRQYIADSDGQLPPEEDISLHRRRNKNMVKSRAIGISTYKVSALTTPVTYIDAGQISDPYAMPEQYAPPAYIRGALADGTRYAVIASPGPNLVYEIRPPDFRNLQTRAQLEEHLARHHHGTGMKGAGDFYRALLINPDSSIDILDGGESTAP